MLLEPTIKTTESDPVCNLPYQAPSGKAAVLQNKFLDMLKEAYGLYKRMGKLGEDQSRYITLEAHLSPVGEPDYITGEIWTKGGEYVRLETTVTAKVERAFRCAVDLEALKLTVNLADKATRIDLKYDPNTNKLTLDGGCWRSSFKGLPLDKMLMGSEKQNKQFEAEQAKELKWVAKAVAPNSEDRWVLKYAYATSENDVSFVAGSDGYRMHVTMNHTEGLDGYVDVNKRGEIPDHNYVNIAAVAKCVTGPKVNLYYGDFLRAIKAACKGIQDKDKIIILNFRNHVLTITGKSFEHGEFNAQALYSGKVEHFCLKVNAKFLLDALANCNGIPNSRDVNQQSIVNIQFGSDEQSPIRLIPHPGRAAYIMPAQNKH